MPRATGILFSGLQIGLRRDSFEVSRLHTVTEQSAAAILTLGLLTSLVILTQEWFLYTNCVTGDTLGASKTSDCFHRGRVQDECPLNSGRFQHTNHRESTSWRRYLIAAPTLWLAQVWC